MKRNDKIVVVVVIIVVTAFACDTVLSALHAAKVMARRDQAEMGIGRLAVSLDFFREENGRYPASLAELVSELDAMAFMVNGEKVDQLADMKNLANGGMQFDYQTDTNGFVLIVTGIDSPGAKWDKIEKRYQAGEAIRQTYGRAARFSTNSPSKHSE